MSTWISLLNNIAVSFFGSILSASFCDALGTRRNRRIFVFCMALIPLLQSYVYSIADKVFLRQIYPLVIHLPLLLVLFALTGKRLWAFVSVLTAYLCCQLRRWFALLVVALLGGGSMMQDIVELAITLPLLLFLLRFVAPSVRRIQDHPTKLQCQFGVIPVLYYVFDYLTVVYTDLLYSGAPAAVEFMPFVCCAAYLVFLMYYSAEEEKRSELKQIQKNLDIQLGQSVREINTLRESQALARRYRHDLRHHLQYVSSCIENEQYELAQNYISGICQEIEAQKVQRYCENEAANLILSSFVGRARRDGIDMKICGTLPTFFTIADSDLCVLLSNALENAIHACQPLAAAGESTAIDVQFYEKESRLFLQVKNPCENNIRFEKGIPVSHRPGHGIGIQSICAIVERYRGVYSFQAKDGEFILRLHL